MSKKFYRIGPWASRSCAIKWLAPDWSWSTKPEAFECRHEAWHSDTQHNDMQHNGKKVSLCIKQMLCWLFLFSQYELLSCWLLIRLVLLCWLYFC